MNNFIHLLTYLKQFEGDGQFHEIESVIDIDPDTKRIVFNQLTREGFITLKGGYRNIDALISIGDGRGNVRTLNMPDKVIYYPFEGQITFKGSDYLKKETIDMQKINVNAKGKSSVNLIINSKKSKIIDNSNKIIPIAHEIINRIESDSTLDAKKKIKAIKVFEKLIEQSQEKSIQPKIWERVTAVGSDIASIGSLVLSLIPLK